MRGLKDFKATGGAFREWFTVGNISSVEDEMVLHTHPGILEAAVGKGWMMTGARPPRAFLKLKEGFDADAREINTFCCDQLSHNVAQVSRTVTFMDLLKTSTGSFSSFMLKFQIG
ncbi:hypothetical protein Ancab_003095 [Ancistrocladus abbreviatus]